MLCKRLHRDISLDNIILVKKRGKWRIGIVVDWELSNRIGRSGKARNYARSVSIAGPDLFHWSVTDILLIREHGHSCRLTHS